MDNEEKPKNLDPKFAEERKLFFRYYHSYMECYYETEWQLEESRLLIKTGNHTQYNVWRLNQSLYSYAESSISALFWICGEGIEHPFVHQFLRRWRNKYHHHSKVDLGVYDFSFTVDDETNTLENDYYIIPNITSNKLLRGWLEEWFPGENIATDATVSGLVNHHHNYMMNTFREKESQMAEAMPAKYLVQMAIEKRLLGGGRYTRFIPEDEFWAHAK